MFCPVTRPSDGSLTAGLLVRATDRSLQSEGLGCSGRPSVERGISNFRVYDKNYVGQCGVGLAFPLKIDLLSGMLANCIEEGTHALIE